MRHGGNNRAFCSGGLVIREACGVRCDAGDGGRLTDRTIVIGAIAAVVLKRPDQVAALRVTLTNFSGRLNAVHAV